MGHDWLPSDDWRWCTITGHLAAEPGIACPTCRTPVLAWTLEDCAVCGRPLDCEAEDDQSPPIGLMDERCSECGEDLRESPRLRCAHCGLMRLLRLDFASDELARAERVLTGHGLQIARRQEASTGRDAAPGAIWIRANCWPSSMWVMEAAEVQPLSASIRTPDESSRLNV